MVAYSFQKQFVPGIQSYAKRQTIRAKGKRIHALKGQMLQLYCGMRTSHCFKIIHDQVCTLSAPMELDVIENRIRSVNTPFGHFIGGDIDDFAARDGFDDADAMHAFWVKNHGTGVFEPQLISWDEAFT